MSEINNYDLSDIDFTDDNGTFLEISDKILEDFKYCGFNNFMFITSGLYDGGYIR